MDKNYNIFLSLCICLLASLNQKHTLKYNSSVKMADENLIQTMEIKAPAPVLKTVAGYPSLINIDTTKATKMTFEQLPKIRYLDTEFLLINDKHIFSLTPQTNENYIILDNQRYDLKQCHIHVSAKHKIDGKLNHMELHIVHESTAGNLAIMGVFLQIGEENDILREAFEKSSQVSKNRPLLLQKINLRELIPYKTRILRYEESLDHQEKQWILCEKAISLSSEQLDSFIAHFGIRSRTTFQENVQPLLYY